MKNKTGKTIVIISAVSVLIIGGILTFLLLSKHSVSSMDRAEKYLSENNYIKAVAEYREVLEKCPENVEAYKGIVAVYEAQGDIDAVYHMLEKGYQRTGDRELGERLESVTQKYYAEKNEISEPEIKENEIETDQPMSFIDDHEMVYIDPEIEELLDEADRSFEYETLSYHERLELALAAGYQLMETPDYQYIREESVLSNWGVNGDITWVWDDYVYYIPDDTNYTHTGVGFGIYSFDGYYFYYGDYVDGKRSGHGISFAFWDNGDIDVYEGEWKDDAPNGYGTLAEIYFYGNGTSYSTGFFVDGIEEGEFSVTRMDCYYNPTGTTEYTVINGIPLEATDKLEQIYEEVEEELAAGLIVDTQKQRVHDKYGISSSEIIYAIYDDYYYCNFWNGIETLGVYGFKPY